MDSTKTIERIIEAENAAKAYAKELEQKEKNFGKETRRIIEDMRKKGYERVDCEIEEEKKAFLKIQSARVENEKKKSAAAEAEILEKKKTLLDSAAERCFREIIEG